MPYAVRRFRVQVRSDVASDGAEDFSLSPTNFPRRTLCSFPSACGRGSDDCALGAKISATFPPPWHPLNAILLTECGRSFDTTTPSSPPRPTGPTSHTQNFPRAHPSFLFPAEKCQVRAKHPLPTLRKKLNPLTRVPLGERKSMRIPDSWQFPSPAFSFPSHPPFPFILA